MLLRTLFKFLKPESSRMPVRQARRGSQARQPAACRLAIEALENRSVPASLMVSDVTLIEGNAGTQYAEVRVTLDAPTTKTVTVNYATANGTATAGSDYEAASGKLTFASGETSKTVRVAVTGDRIGEPNESFTVNLQGAKNAKIAGRQGIVTILDNEPRISISNGVEAAGSSGTRLWTFDVSLTSASDQEVTVNYATADGTAIAGVDYLATSGTLSFAPGETTKSITVEYFGSYEAYFYVNLSGASTNAWFDSVPQAIGGYPPGEPCTNCGVDGDGGYQGTAP